MSALKLSFEIKLLIIFFSSGFWF